MNNSGDAAEQMIRMSLEGVEVAAKITGSAAKEIAIMLIAALKSKNSTLKPRGKARLVSMLRSGKPLEIFSVKESDLQKFVQGAKQYGIVYCVLRNTKNSPDGMVDIMVKADDAPKISRLVERFKFATVDKGRIESEIIADRAARTEDTPSRETPYYSTDAPGIEPEDPELADTEKLLDELLGAAEGIAEPDAPEVAAAEVQAAEPNIASPVAGIEDSRPLSESPPPSPSEPISESEKNSEKPSLSKRSVKEDLREIKAARKAKDADATHSVPTAADKPKDAPVPAAHKQPLRVRYQPKQIKESR